MRRPSSRELALVVQPCSRGFAFILFEGPLSPAVWNIKEIRGPKKLSLIYKHVADLMERYHPDLLIIEDVSHTKTKQMSSRRRLMRMLTAYAQARSIDTYAYTRKDIRNRFAYLGALTRYEIAEAIAGQIPAFKRVPPKRKPWNSEHRRMTLFDAASLAITYYGSDATFRPSP